ncbi:MAG: hypothetical protein H0T46_11070 [Deltaproteobacteria bacterium]|nr:hypothetical protein [Deltaproteobacteria bacterium]
MIVAIVLALLALAMRLAVAAPAREIPARDPDDVEESDELFEELDELVDQPGTDEWGEDLATETEWSDSVIDRDELLELDEDTPIDDLDALGGAVRAESPARSAPVRSRSPIGRFDLSLIYRHSDPISRERRDELWLVGTWRR